MATIETGYSEFTYLDEVPYMAGRIEDCLPTQIRLKVDTANNLGTQTQLRIFDENILNTQTTLRINSSEELLTQIEAINNQLGNLGIQTKLRINDDNKLGAQAILTITPEDKLLTQVLLEARGNNNLNTQVALKRLGFTNATGMQIIFGKTRVHICPEGQYLETFPYLTDNPYLTARFCADLHTQVELKRFTQTPLNTQILMRINELTNLPMQVLWRIFDQNNLNMQVILSAAEKLNTQVNLFVYNNTQLRILCDFPSRGIPALGGNNWTSVQAIAAGDFDVNNLNTDIVEERTQTDGINALWQLRCDTGLSNTFVDTLAILNHNFTTSARVEIQGSDDPGFGTIKFTIVMDTELTNMYYVAPTLPNIPARYYQISIQDPTNTDADGLKIGTIVFGSSLILTRNEQFINPVTYGNRHFKDTLDTEGFTSSSNDRALRKFLNLTFTQLLIDGGNFETLQNYILTAKTDLKCLVIPRPTRPSALAVFAKLSQLPEELHNAIDDDNWRVDMTFDWDESL